MKKLLGAGVALAVGLALAGCSAGAAPRPAHKVASDDTYGSLPSFLPKDTTHPDSVLTGTVESPAITSQGDSVRVPLGSGSALVSVTGPVVPGEGLPYQTEATTCTWTITVKAAGTSIPIRASDFTSIDHLGAIYHPAWIPHRVRPGATLAAGHSVTFELRAVMKTGEGLMRWTPDGKHIVASWDFEVEND